MAKWVKLPSGTFVNTDLIASAALCGGKMTLKRKKPSESILLSPVDTNAMLSWLDANSEIVPPAVIADAPVTVNTSLHTNAASGQSVRGCGAICLCGKPDTVHGGWPLVIGVCDNFRDREPLMNLFRTQYPQDSIVCFESTFFNVDKYNNASPAEVRAAWEAVQAERTGK